MGKPIGPASDYAESWEISDHGIDQSIVTGGAYAGESLSDLVRKQSQPLLGRSSGVDQFPLLVKFLDANDALSLQVHPDDRLAKEFDPAENGKTEAWVILEATPESRLYVGFEKGVTESDVRAAVDSGGLQDLLHAVSVQAGDCVFVRAGTVHAIGAGILLAEIQQSSDITFRLYDWDRIGADGQPRELHVEQALRCIDFDRGPVDPVVPRTLPADHSLEVLVDCEYFTIHRHRCDVPFSIAADDACHVLMVLGGSATLHASGREVSLPLGQTVLLPAERGDISIHPPSEVTILDAFLSAGMS